MKGEVVISDPLWNTAVGKRKLLTTRALWDRGKNETTLSLTGKKMFTGQGCRKERESHFAFYCFEIQFG